MFSITNFPSAYGGAAVCIVYISPETITASFWWAAFTGPLKKAVSFIVVDEAHLIDEWGTTQHTRNCFELSATAPLSVISAVFSNLNVSEFKVISGPLD